MEETRQQGAENEGRLPTIDSREAMLDPAPDGILMHIQESGDLLDGVTTVDLDQPMVGTAHSEASLAVRYFVARGLAGC
jgi:hypothetical protein